MSLLNAVAIRKLLALTLPPLPISAGLFRLLLIAALTVLGLIIARFPLVETALLLGGAIFLTLLLIKPIFSLYILIPIIPFSPLFALSIGGINVGLMEIVLALGIIAWLLQISILHKHPNPKYLQSKTRNPQGNCPKHWHLRCRPQARPAQVPQGGFALQVSEIRNPKSEILLWPFLLFLGGVGLSWLNTLSIGASLIETIKWVEMLALYLFIVALLPVRHIKWVVAVLLLTGVAQAILGLYQFIFKVGPEGFLLFDGRFLRAYGTFAQPNPYAGYLGLVLPLSLALAIWRLTDFRHLQCEASRWDCQPQAGQAQLSSNVDFGSTPQSETLALALPAAGQTGASPTGRQQAVRSLPVVAGLRTVGIRNPKSKILCLVLFSVLPGLLLAALFATQSRAAWLGFAVAAGATFTIYSKKTAVIMTTVILAGTIIALVGVFNLNVIKFNASYEVIAQRLVDAISIFTITDVASIEVNDANFATVERLAHWQAAREMWRDNPWLGVGFGNYAVVYPAYAAGRWLNPLGHAHNYLLNIGAGTGLVGITAYLIFWIFTFAVLWLVIRRSHGFYRAVAAGGLGIMVHLHVHNLFDNLYVQGMYLHIAIILALVSVIYKRQLPPNEAVGNK